MMSDFNLLGWSKPLSTHIILLGVGWNNLVFKIDEDHVIKIAIRPSATAHLENELRILNQVGELGISVGHYTTDVVFTASMPYGAVRCRRVRGQHLCDIDIDEGRDFTLLAQDLGRVFSRITRLGQTECYLPKASPDMFESSRLQQFLEDITTHGWLEPKIIKHIHHICNRNLNDSLDSVFGHGDIHVRNMLVSLNQGILKLEGIVDWASSGLGQCINDLACIRLMLGITAWHNFLAEFDADLDLGALQDTEILAVRRFVHQYHHARKFRDYPLTIFLQKRMRDILDFSEI